MVSETTREQKLLSQRLLIAVVAPVGLLLPVGVILAFQIVKLTDTAQWVEHTDEVIGRVGESMGAAGYLLKPVQREALLSVFNGIKQRFSHVRRLPVVEDDAVQRDAVTQLLSSQDVEVIAVASVGEAEAALAAGVFDCVVTDLSLPDASGYEARRAPSTRSCESCPMYLLMPASQSSSSCICRPIERASCPSSSARCARPA